MCFSTSCIKNEFFSTSVSTSGYLGTSRTTSGCFNTCGIKTDVTVALDTQVDISLPLEPQVDVSVPTEQQMCVSPRNAMCRWCCTENKIYRSRHVLIYLFTFFLFFIHKCMCLYILGQICNAQNYYFAYYQQMPDRHLYL